MSKIEDIKVASETNTKIINLMMKLTDSQRSLVLESLKPMFESLNGEVNQVDKGSSQVDESKTAS